MDQINQVYQQFQRKASDLLNTDWNLGITNLQRLIKFIDATPIIYKFVQQQVLSYPLENINSIKTSDVELLFQSIIKEGIDGKEVSFLYQFLKSEINKNETDENWYYQHIADILLGRKYGVLSMMSDKFNLVDKFNNDFVRPYFINHINSYLESIMEDQKNAGTIFNYYNSQFGIGQMSGGKIGDQAIVAGVINEAEQRNLAEVAKEIQQLLDQLSETYPTTTTSEKYEVAAKAIKTIEDDSLLTSKIIRVLKAALTEALKQAVNHPLMNILMAGVEEALEQK